MHCFAPANVRSLVASCTAACTLPQYGSVVNNLMCMLWELRFRRLLRTGDGYNSSSARWASWESFDRKVDVVEWEGVRLDSDCDRRRREEDENPATTDDDDPRVEVEMSVDDADAASTDVCGVEGDRSKRASLFFFGILRLIFASSLRFFASLRSHFATLRPRVCVYGFHNDQRTTHTHTDIHNQPRQACSAATASAVHSRRQNHPTLISPRSEAPRSRSTHTCESPAPPS